MKKKTKAPTGQSVRKALAGVSPIVLAQLLKDTEPPVIFDGIDLTIPSFLRAQGKRLSDEQVRNLSMPNRSWAPFRDHTQRTPKTAPPMYVSDRGKQVVVSVKGKEGATRHDGMDDFEAAHDFGTYPLSRLVEMENEIIVIVTAKPWADVVRKPKSTTPRGPSKAELIGALLLRPEGCTSKDVLEATGWPAVSMPAQAKSVGLKLRKEKVDGVTRYWGSK